MAVIGAVFAFSPTEAAQYYIQPLAEITLEADTNVVLDNTGNTHSTEGYLGDLGATIGIATPRSETTIAPRVHYQHYNEYDEANRLEEYFNLASAYRSERSSLNVYGTYQHQDGLHADLTSARFDPLNPTLTTTNPDTGRVRVGATRDLISLAPNYTYSLTQRVNLNLSAQYQRIDYNPSDPSVFVNFDYYQGNIGLSRSITQRSDVSLGAHAGRYEARDIESTTNSVGGDLGLETHWSKLLTARWHVSFEREHVDQTSPSGSTDSQHAWGADFSLARRHELSTVLISIGRTVTPSGGGGMYYVDQVQLEYDRNFSQRWSSIVAGRFLREDSLASSTGSGRDYFQSYLQAKWQITRTWYVRGGYQYTWQKYEDTRSAGNHSLGLSFGYEGLAPQR